MFVAPNWLEGVARRHLSRQRHRLKAGLGGREDCGHIRRDKWITSDEARQRRRRGAPSLRGRSRDVGLALALCLCGRDLGLALALRGGSRDLGLALALRSGGDRAWR